MAAAPAKPAPDPPGAIFSITIVKGDDGMGLDIGKIASGACMIRNLKEMPAGRPNPAAHCDIKGGDIIIGINGQRVDDFQSVVNIIRGLANGAVQLTLERSAL